MQVSSIPKLTYFRGRVALCSILKAMGIGHGDKVATQAFTCLAVPEGIMASGARPLYIDITKEGYTLDTEDLKYKICDYTKAIIVQHTFGIPAAILDILEIAENWGIPVIEDCCHTLTSKVHGQNVGTYGTAAFYSYEWGKPIVAGIGGSVRVLCPELQERLEHQYQTLTRPSLITQLKLEAQYLAYWALYRPAWYWRLKKIFHRSAKLGVAQGNYNVIPENEDASSDFSTLMAPRFRRRLGRALNSVEQHANHARHVVSQYRLGINSSEVMHPENDEESETTFARYPLRVNDKARMIANASQQGIELAEWYNTAIHPLEHHLAGSVNYQLDSCPRAQQRSSEIVSLPTHRRVTDRYIDRAVEFLQEVA